jgi:hypothetical protein
VNRAAAPGPPAPRIGPAQAGSQSRRRLACVAIGPADGRSVGRPEGRAAAMSGTVEDGATESPGR